MTGCPKGVVKRKADEIRALILAELARGDRSVPQLMSALGMVKGVVERHVKALVDEKRIHACGLYVSGRGGTSPMMYRLGKRGSKPPAQVKLPEPDALSAAFYEVRTTIRGPWPVSAPGRPAT